MLLVDFGKRFLEVVKRGETDDVRILMFNGVLFIIDWVFDMIVKIFDN